MNESTRQKITEALEDVIDNHRAFVRCDTRNCSLSTLQRARENVTKSEEKLWNLLNSLI